MDTPENSSKDVVETQTETTEAPKALELDGLSEFSYQGEKYNPERLQAIFGEHKNLSEQKKEYEQTKKFEDNLQIDLDNVLQDPRLASKFKQIYPQKYHWLADRLLSNKGQTQASPAPQNAQTALPKEFLNEFGAIANDVKLFKEQMFQSQVEAANARLDAVLPPMFKKFPLANEEQVYARAEAKISKNEKMTDASWERFIRESHEANKKKSDQYQAAQAKAQLEKGRQGKDTGAGGATPGQAPRKARTFDEAYDEMMRAHGKAS